MRTKYFLLTALLLFAGVSEVFATKRYVGFNSGGDYSNAQLQNALNDADASNDTVCVATGLYIADAAEFIVPEGVTLIGGYNKGSTTAPRRYPGEFVPFDSSVVNQTHFTILDGNSYQRTLPTQKHRVVTVKAGGVVDGCLIRNGHVRNDHGGGVLLDGGKLYNSIVRGNVAMSKPDTIESLGGGVFIKNAGELINCLVAYNMANDGYGVAAGAGGGKMINNTITANTYSPVFAKIQGTNGAATFRMYQGDTITALGYKHRPAVDTIKKWTALIGLSDFYISRILTTEGQYAVFCAAMDIPLQTDGAGVLSTTTFRYYTDPMSGIDFNTRYPFGSFIFTGLVAILKPTTVEADPGLRYANGVWHPHLDTASVEYPMGNVTWWGALTYAVWLGGSLPTEAQWEFAARRNPGGAGNNMVNDDLYSGAYGSSYGVSNGKNDATDMATWRILDSIAWVDKSRSIDTSAANFGNLGAAWANRVHEVARKRPNAMGIYDMTGLMAEWCADLSGNTGLANEIYTSGTTDPIRPTTPGFGQRVTRGRGWNNTTREHFSLQYRGMMSGDGFNTPTMRNDLGFRPVVAF